MNKPRKAREVEKRKKTDLNAVFKAVELPAGVTHLDPSLTNVD